MTKPRSTTSDDPGNLGEEGGDQAAGAAFGRCKANIQARHTDRSLPRFRRQSRENSVKVRSDPGSRTVTVAKAAIPSPRPMKPNVSVVVALIAMRSTPMRQ